MDFAGQVVKKPLGVGSKSERQAVALETAEGTYVLRFSGGHPLQDPRLDALVGKQIRCSGELHGYTLIIESVEEVQGP